MSPQTGHQQCLLSGQCHLPPTGDCKPHEDRTLVGQNYTQTGVWGFGVFSDSLSRQVGDNCSLGRLPGWLRGPRGERGSFWGVQGTPWLSESGREQPAGARISLLCLLPPAEGHSDGKGISHEVQAG